jgi:hypothetical protein
MNKIEGLAKHGKPFFIASGRACSRLIPKEAFVAVHRHPGILRINGVVPIEHRRRESGKGRA